MSKHQRDEKTKDACSRASLTNPINQHEHDHKTTDMFNQTECSTKFFEVPSLALSSKICANRSCLGYFGLKGAPSDDRLQNSPANRATSVENRHVGQTRKWRTGYSNHGDRLRQANQAGIAVPNRRENRWRRRRRRRRRLMLLLPVEGSSDQ